MRISLDEWLRLRKSQFDSALLHVGELNNLYLAGRMNRIIAKLRTFTPLISSAVVMVLLVWMLTPQRASETHSSGARFFKNASEQMYVPLDPNKGNSPTTTSKNFPFSFEGAAFLKAIERSGKIFTSFFHVAPIERNAFYTCISINAP